MAHARPTKLDPPVDPGRDHILGNPEAELTLVEYGNYTRPSCHAAHEVIADLRDRFGERMRYVFRHRPAGESGIARRAAELAEYAFRTTGEFWPIHDALMKHGPAFTPDDFEQIARGIRIASARRHTRGSSEIRGVEGAGGFGQLAPERRSDDADIFSEWPPL